MENQKGKTTEGIYRSDNNLKSSIYKYYPVSDKTVSIVSDLFEEKNIKKNDILIHEEEGNSKFGLLISGILRMYVSSETGVEINKHFITQNTFFTGSTEDDRKSLVSIKALENSKVLFADYRKINELADKKNDWLKFKNRVISEYIEIKSKRENSHLLLQSLEKYKIFLNDFPGLLNRIPHYHIASYLGITPTQLSRIRKEFTQN